MNDYFDISQLIKKSITNNLSNDEKKILEKWLNASNENRKLYDKLVDTKYQRKKLEEYNAVNAIAVRKKLEARIFVEKRRFISQTALKYAAAILIPLLVVGGIGLYFLKQDVMTMANINEQIKPGTQKATLVLSNGKSVMLDKNKTESTIMEKGIAIKNKDSKLNYKSTDSGVLQAEEQVYNQLKTPRGGGYNVVLADGTNVWLNSDSELKYPVQFTDSTRAVYLTGEAYFDVSHNGKPFIVKANKMDVRVLGTKFNVNAYQDDDETITTLVEGKVAINVESNLQQNHEGIVLTPGLQATLNKSNMAIDVSKVNTSHYTSWIEGKLEFSNQDLEHVIRRLARWYDFDYSFQNEEAKKYRFSARVSSEESISEILSMLEMTTDVQFKIEENSIVIH